MSIFQTLKTAFFSPVYGWRTTHFWGPVANWGIALAGVYDMTSKDASVISIPMTGSLALYSLAFMRFAWQVVPRNYILLSCHVFNEGVQLVQLWRGVQYQKSLGEGITRESEFSNLTVASGAAGALAGSIFLARMQPRIAASSIIPQNVKTLLNHPAGPFTIFFWAPLMKWALSIANLADYKRPVEKVSVPQQLSLTITGLIWTRWSFVISPVNYSLAAVNAALALTGAYHLSRKLTAFDPFAK